MKNQVVTIVSRTLEESEAIEFARNWHAYNMWRPHEDILFTEDTFYIPIFCRRPDRIESIGGSPIGPVLTPSIDLVFSQKVARLQGAFSKLQRLFLFFTDNALRDRLQEIALVVSWSFHARGSFNIGLRWKEGSSSQYSGVTRVGIACSCQDCRKPELVCRHFQGVFERAGLEGQIRVCSEKGSLAFSFAPPWEVLRSGDNAMTIGPFSSVDGLLTFGLRLAEVVVEPLSEMSVRVSNIPISCYNEMCERLPSEFQGWDVGVFGHPTEATWEWLHGNMMARPRSRVPLGLAWVGDANDGMQISLSMLDESSGPVVEIGSDCGDAIRLLEVGKSLPELGFRISSAG